MATNSRLTANRQNAQHSTGPRTEAGKAASARNAVTFGLFSRRDYVQPGERSEYQELCRRCAAELRPEGILEESCVLSIISAYWRMRRCSLVELEHAEEEYARGSHRDPMADAYAERFQNAVDRARNQSQLQLRRATAELRDLQTARALARRFLAAEADLPPVIHSQKIDTAIDRHRRAVAQGRESPSLTRVAATAPLTMGSFCKNEPGPDEPAAESHLTPLSEFPEVPTPGAEPLENAA